MDGILNLNKPPGRTSFDMVALVRRLTGCRRVGHAGTLDPDASGVLLICVGKATRMAASLSAMPKTYKAEVHLGVSTDTYDASGRVTYQRDITAVNLEDVKEALTLFRGTIQQRPPLHSALKLRGRRLYELARSGAEMEPAPRPVQVWRLELVHWTPPILGLEIECGKGTYIRSIAHDLGNTLGCGAHLTSLTRTRSGPFSIVDSVAVTQFELACQVGYWQQLLYPLDAAVLHWPSAILGPEEERLVMEGRDVPLEGGGSGYEGPGMPAFCRAYSPDGRLLAILEFVSQRNRWHPLKVFADGRIREGPGVLER
jgi:tRNA pseudouridine55 synthase